MWSSIGNAVSSGWDTASNFATNAFGWINDNPGAANVLGGIAAGAAQGYMQNQQAKDQRVFEREMYDRRKRDRQITPGDTQGYDSHLNLTRGLLTHGMITGEE